jgi:DNA/RNA non-specific endonuclease
VICLQPVTNSAWLPTKVFFCAILTYAFTSYLCKRCARNPFTAIFTRDATHKTRAELFTRRLELSPVTSVNRRPRLLNLRSTSILEITTFLLSMSRAVRMSKTTLAIIAAASAGAGAAVTAALYSSTTQRKVNQASTSTQLSVESTTTSASPPAPGILRSAQQINAAGLIAPVDPAGLFQYGFPGPVNDLATRHALVSSFDRRTRNPNWSAEHITAESLASREGDRRHSYFTEDAAGKFSPSTSSSITGGQKQ